MAEHPEDILQLAHREPILQDNFVLLVEKERQIPGAVQYRIFRYDKAPFSQVEDTGMLYYRVTPGEPNGNYLELKFCMAGNTYCVKNDADCGVCPRALQSRTRETVDVVSLRFSQAHLSQFLKPDNPQCRQADEMLNFTHPRSCSKTLPLCSRTRMVLEAFLNHSFTGSLENIYINAQIHMLLLYSMECMVGEKETDGFQCKFLANDADREKIIKSREILLQHIGEPLTIKALSRKVAINECYLKKGFKELFGITIFDFYQSQRMEHARYLLYEKGLSVTDVSMLLGYSSISHFSTAFKKHTGIKPCELLLR
jgi:AraC family transcriptional regulator